MVVHTSRPQVLFYAISTLIIALFYFPNTILQCIIIRTLYMPCNLVLLLTTSSLDVYPLPCLLSQFLSSSFCRLTLYYMFFLTELFLLPTG